jgi:TRAP-type transport system periplasmic protein
VIRTTRLLACAIALMGSVAAGHVAGAQTVLRFAHTQPTSDTHHLAAERFAEIVEERSGGDLRVDIHPAGELGNDPSILEGARLGTIDIAQTGNPFYTRFVPKLNVLDLPFLFADYDHVYAAIDGPIGDELLAELDDHGLKGLTFWEIGFRKLTNNQRAVSTPEDVKGLKIRTTPNPAHVQAFELLGAIPTPMPFTEVYLALETGTVDGQENPLNIIRSNQFQEVQDHLSYTDHAYTVSIVSMNRGKFDGLPEEQQQILLEAAQEAATYQRDLNREQATADRAAIEAAGVEVIEDVDRDAFREIVYEPVKQTYVDQFGPEIVDRIEAMK